MSDFLKDKDFPDIPIIQQYERKIFDLKQLIEISKGLNSSLEYNILIDSILLTCMGQMQLIKAGIFIQKGLDDKSYVLHRSYKGYDLDHDIEYILPETSHIIKILEVDYDCIDWEDVKSSIEVDTQEYETLHTINPTLIVPLKGKDKLNGIIILGERINEEPFNESEREYLLNIASLAGIAIQNAYLYELATTDMMTKLKIHHFFQTCLIEERERSYKQKLPLSVMMIDVDHFKKFNDTYGHQIGDKVLKEVARVIKDSCRQIDVAARYGGEEMSIILPNTILASALKVAERIRRDIENLKVDCDGEMLSVTVSIGVAEYESSVDNDNHTLIERADKALYMSKEKGRNKVSCLY